MVFILYFFFFLSTDQCQTFKEISEEEIKGRKWNVLQGFCLIYLAFANSEITDERLFPEAKGGSFFYQVKQV